MNIKGTKSEQNIKNSLLGESLARNKYSFYAAKAKEEGNEEIAAMFERMATNEMHHAKIWFNLLNGKPISSESNLKDASAGEYQEWSSMYPSFAKEAREEGLEDLAAMFERVAEIEKHHEAQFLEAYAKLMAKGTVPAVSAVESRKESKPAYRCVFCGAEFEQRPDVCEVCGAIGSFDRI